MPVYDPLPSLPVVGSAPFPVRRILCIGKNYAAHVREMGGDAREAPIFFGKSPDALLVADGPIVLPYPPRTSNLHHEVELVLALGAGGRDVPVDRALELVWAVGIGLDMTRRDVQAEAKKKGNPWTAAKDFDGAAIVGPLRLALDVGVPQSGPISLDVNGTRRQSGDLADMIWSVAELLAELSTWGELRAGDLVFTGTPEGVGPVIAGDRMEASIAGLGSISVDVG